MRCVTWCALAGLLVLGLSASPAGANGIPFPRPGPQPQPQPQPQPRPASGVVAPLVVVADENVKEARLEIPRKLLRSLRADLGEEQEPDTRRVEAAPLPRLHTILAGGALSLALVTGGLWLTRSRHRLAGRGLLMLLVAGGFLLLGSGVLWADLAPRPNPFGPRPNPLPNPGMRPVVPVLPAGITLDDKVAIVVVDKGDAITLVVNRADLVRVVEKTAPDNNNPKVNPPVLPRPIFPQRPGQPGLPPG
jgi:hypothetical protein